jgi:Phage conserved hypothetical protein BR0599
MASAVPLPGGGTRIIARIVTVGGTQVGLLVAKPNWDTEVTVSLELPTDIEKQPITFYESRRNFAQSARYSLTWRSYLFSAADATELRIFLTRVRGETVVAPLWTDGCELAPSTTQLFSGDPSTVIPQGSTQFPLVDLPARYTNNWIITNSDFSTWEIVTVTSLNIATKIITITPGVQNIYHTGDMMYPLIYGRLAERPHPEAITDETADVDFTIKESSAFNFRITPITTIPIQLVGPHIHSFQTLPLWNMAPNFVRPIDWTEMPDIVYEHIGFLREDQQRVYDHRNARGEELEFFESTRDTIGKIEYFWRDRRATTLRFMLPTYKGDMRMLFDTPIQNAWVIVCERSYFSAVGREVQPGDPFICLVGANNVVDPYEIAQAIDDPTDNQTWLACTVNVGPHAAATTIVCHLLLVRFAEAKLEWSYTTPYLATTRIKFQELPHEYPPHTTTVLPEPAYLYHFIEVGIRHDYYTSYENTIIIAAGDLAGTYIPAPFSFSTVKSGLKLDQEKIEIKSFKFAGNPLNKLWPFALDGILQVRIDEVDANQPNSTRTINRFFGDVFSVDSEWKATAIPFSSFFDRKFPRFLLSVSDNYTQFSPPTMLSATAFRIDGNISGNVDPTSQIVTIASAPGHAKPTDYFAGGWIECGYGVNVEKRGILHSSPGSSNLVVLTIDRPLIKSVNNTAVNLYPGYDGSIDQCDTKFNNRINFGGHAYIPNVNPSVKAMKPQDVQGGKKRG